MSDLDALPLYVVPAPTEAPSCPAVHDPGLPAPGLGVDLPPWRPVLRRPAGFLRMLPVPGDRLADAVAGWSPVARPGGAWTVRSSLLGRDVDLHLWPRLGAWTMVALEPLVDVRPSRRWFRAGHELLDRLERELVDAAYAGSVATPLQTRPVEVLEPEVDETPETGSPKVAHIVKPSGGDAAAKVLEARIYGTPLEALCGEVFVPQRDPTKLPLCAPCKEIYDVYRAFNEGLGETPDS